jgi:hypothetical protein
MLQAFQSTEDSLSVNFTDAGRQGLADKILHHHPRACLNDNENTDHPSIIHGYDILPVAYAMMCVDFRFSPTLPRPPRCLCVLRRGGCNLVQMLNITIPSFLQDTRAMRGKCGFPCPAL